MSDINLSKAAEKNKAAISALEKSSGVKLSDCYQCGKCSAGCPVGDAMDVLPRQVIRMLQLNMLPEALKCKSVWLCASCHTCLARCPHSVNISGLMEAVHQEAKKQGIISVPEVDIFHKLFLANVRRFGKSHEMFLSGFYNLYSKHFMQDVASAPHLYFNGKIRIRPHKTNDREAIKKIFANCLSERGDQ